MVHCKPNQVLLGIPYEYTVGIYSYNLHSIYNSQSTNTIVKNNLHSFTSVRYIYRLYYYKLAVLLGNVPNYRLKER
jgi:hypothetical protein